MPDEGFDNVEGTSGGVLNLDFTGVTDGFEAMPVGLYLAIVQKIERKQSKAGNPMLVVTFNVTEPEEFAGRKLWDRLSLLPQSMWVVKRFLKGVGVADEDLTGPLQIDLDEVIGAETVVVIEQGMYEGKTTSNISKYLPAGTPLTGDDDSDDGDIDLDDDDDDDAPF